MDSRYCQNDNFKVRFSCQRYLCQSGTTPRPEGAPKCSTGQTHFRIVCQIDLLDDRPTVAVLLDKLNCVPVSFHVNLILIRLPREKLTRNVKNRQVIEAKILKWLNYWVKPSVPATQCFVI